MIYKIGDKGEAVKKIQLALGIDSDGIFGPWTEKAVMQFQADNGLEVDGIVGEKTWAALFKDDIQIINNPIFTHITRSAGRQIKYICLHYTAGVTSKSGAAMGTRQVFLKRNASADFVVDDQNIVQINPDIKNYYCWAVGDKKNPYTGGGQLKGLVSNKNSISIEMCSNLKQGASSSAVNHEGWYFTEKTLENTKKLVKYLQKTYNIPKSNVIRHYDATGKCCPGLIDWNDGPLYTTDGKSTKTKNNSSEWKNFLEAL